MMKRLYKFFFGEGPCSLSLGPSHSNNDFIMITCGLPHRQPGWCVATILDLGQQELRPCNRQRSNSFRLRLEKTRAFGRNIRPATPTATSGQKKKKLQSLTSWLQAVIRLFLISASEHPECVSTVGVNMRVKGGHGGSPRERGCPAGCRYTTCWWEAPPPAHKKHFLWLPVRQPAHNPNKFIIKKNKNKFIKNTLLAACTMLLLSHNIVHAALQQTAPSNLTFATSTPAFGGESPALYIGAAPRVRSLGGDKKLLTYKLAQIIADPTSGELTNNILKAFAPEKVTLDGSEGDHPLLEADTVIAQMATIAHQFPLLALAKYDPEGKAEPTGAGLFLVSDTKHGAIISQAPALKDHAGTEITAPIVALAAGEKLAFAAVATAEKQFDDPLDTKRSIAILKYGEAAKPASSADDEDGGDAPAAGPTLTQISGANVNSADVKALAIDLSAQGAPMLAFGDGSPNSIKQALVGKKACMAWDETLQRLYVGFTDVRRDDATKVGGVLGLAIVYPIMNRSGELQNFSATPIVDLPEVGKFYTPVQTGLTEVALPNFPVDLSDVKICMEILKKANDYVRQNSAAMNTAENLLAHLKSAVSGITFGTKTAAHFLSDFNTVATFPLGEVAQGANHLYIFGKDADINTVPVTGAAQNAANSHKALRDAIRTRLVELLANAKTRNKTSAMTEFYTNSLDFIFGFYADGKTPRQDFDTGIVQARNDGNDDLAVSIPHCAVMQTSTDRPYLIVHSIMSTSPFSFGGTFYNEADNWIYALPLIKEGINGRDDTKGTIAKVTDDAIGKVDLTKGGATPGSYQLPISYKDMPRRFQTAVRVGGGNPIPASWVQNMFVSGDSVYIALAGIQTGLQGIFKSTALFDDKGCIINWTPATRVMGSAVQTYAAMLDPKSANFYALTQTPTAKGNGGGATTAQVTQWGKGQANMHGGDTKYALDTVLGSIFQSNKGGVHGVASFDEMTYGLPKKQLGMLLAYGFDTVALIQTGKSNGSTFAPITRYATTADATKGIEKNVWSFTGAGVSNIGPILCGGVVHNPGNWTRFYIGGYRGLAHLEVAYPNNADFLNNIKNMGGVNFTHVGNIGAHAVKNVIAVGQTTDGTKKLHVLTKTGVIAADLNHANTAQQTLSNVIDGIVLADGTLAATSNGLHFVKADGSAPKGLGAGVGQILQMEAITARTDEGLPCLPAVVYVLSMGPILPEDVEPDNESNAAPVDSETRVPQVWRLAVRQEGADFKADILDTYQTHPTLKGKPRPYAQYNELRLNFSADGSVLFDAASKDGLNNDFLRIMAITSPLPSLTHVADTQTSITEQLGVNRTSNFKVGRPQREKVSGAWLVPGDWGLRMNE